MSGIMLRCKCGRDMKRDPRPRAPLGVYLCGCGSIVQVRNMIENRCVAPRRHGRLCGDPAAITTPVPLCDAHLTDLLEDPHVLRHKRVEHVVKLATEAEALRRVEREKERMRLLRQEQQRDEALRKQQVVYYIRRDSRIKIGTTTNMQQRMSQLMPDEILATEPGGRAMEKQRHKQFAHIRYRGEWFTPSEELLAHIEAVRAEHGEPAMTRYVPAGVWL